MLTALKPYLYAAGAVAIIAAIGVSGWQGYTFGRDRERGYWQQLRADELERRSEVSTATQAAAVRRATEREAEISDLQKQVDQYEAALARECLVPDTDARRLQNIR